jgi:hypothetical protein
MRFSAVLFGLAALTAPTLAKDSGYHCGRLDRNKLACSGVSVVKCIDGFLVEQHLCPHGYECDMLDKIPRCVKVLSWVEDVKDDPYVKNSEYPWVLRDD